MEEEQKEQEETPKKLYHYTSYENAMSILGSKELWLTNIKCVADKSELEYPVKQFILTAVVKLQSKFGENDFTEFSTNMVALLKIIGEVLNIDIANILKNIKMTKQYEDVFVDFIDKSPRIAQNSYELYSFCLSEFDYNISLWREYSIKGKGICLGFNTDNVPEIYGHALNESYYDIDLFIKTIFTVLNSFKINDPKSSEVSSLINEFIRLKHPCYKTEEEYKFTIPVKDNSTDLEISYLSKPNRTVEYLKVPFEPELISEIIFGYNSPLDENDYGLRKFLDSNGYGHAEFKKSDIPERH
jgi:Protein of unknown function (DUF2971)